MASPQRTVSRPTWTARVTGTVGPPVVLLAGGAASSHGFFPGLLDVLGGHQVVEMDRPGTGRAAALGGAPTLAAGATAIAELLDDLGAGPAVVVGQSLGGAQAAVLAALHPERVAGLVLVDPTPLDLPKLIGPTRAVFGVLGLPGRLPVVGPRLERLVWSAMSGRVERHPDTDDAWIVMSSSATFAATARALGSFSADAALALPLLKELEGPGVLITAERKAGDQMRASHERLAGRIGARVVAPEGAVHAEHLRDPHGVNALVVSVVSEAFATSGARKGLAGA